MSLKSIIDFVAPKVAVNLESTADRALLVQNINEAALEIHRSDDLANCLFEQVFSVDLTEQQITLPYYVEFVRGVRNYDYKHKINLHTMRPRYQEFQTEYSTLDWRTKGEVCLAVDMTNASALTFTLAEAETEQFEIVVVGSTTTSQRVREVVTFEVGDIEKTTTNSFQPFPPINTISKSMRTKSDVSVTDASDNEIAMIANNMDRSMYNLIQVSSDETVNNGCTCYEVLFKHRFIPFYNDEDEFMYPHFDMAIAWQAYANYFANTTDPNKLAIAATAQNKASKLMQEATRDVFRNHQMVMERTENRFFAVHRHLKGFPFNRRALRD